MKKNKKIIFIIGVLLISIIVTAIFFFDIKSKKTLKLPKVYFKGNIENMLTKEDERVIELEYVDGDKTFKSYAKIKIQGTSSLSYAKKNYTIKLYNDKNLEEKKKIDVGWGEQNKYCLKANWIDKTHARNIVTAELAAEIQKKYNLFMDTPHNGTIDGYPVEIYINGDFLGLYTWNIPKDAWMWNMDEENENHIVFSNEMYEKTNLFEEEATYGPWKTEVGIENEENLQKLNRLIKFVIESSDEEFRKNINEYLNLDSTLNYFIMLYYANLGDNTAKNMMLVTYDGKIWYPSLYDLDTSWGTNSDGITLLKEDSYKTITNVKLWKRIEENFPNELYERYLELRKDILTKENVMNNFNNFKDSIPVSSFEKEQEKWKHIPGFDYSQIETYLDERIPIIDKYMESLVN
ncbi:MAG: CotH kinase family protein [bacterium]|nr:CotH kinase family protein [bacterium]